MSALTLVLNPILAYPLVHFKKRAMLVTGAIAYVALYQLLYITWLAESYRYFGFDYVVPPTPLLLLAWGLSLLPVMWSPLSLERPSLMIYWVLYFTVFVPSMFVPMFVRLSSLADIVKLMLTIFTGFCILCLTYVLPLPRFKNDLIRPRIFWTVLSLTILGLYIWILFVFRSNFHFVDFGDVYELRSDADVIMAGSRVAYALTWLAGSINPFLMARGLAYRKWWMFWLGCAGELFLYSAAGNKATILVPLMILAFYMLLRKGTLSFAPKLSFVFTSALISLYAALMVFIATDWSALNYALGIFFMRTLGLPGLFSAQYFSFFQTNPLTYFSHVTGPSFFIRYPYAKQLGLEIGQKYSGFFDLNFNAHFWATDGLAGLGLPGVILISMICALLFWVLDFSANGHRPIFTALAVVYAAINISNASLFTTALTGGLFLTILLLLFLPKDSAKQTLNS